MRLIFIGTYGVQNEVRDYQVNEFSKRRKQLLEVTRYSSDGIVIHA